MYRVTILNRTTMVSTYLTDTRTAVLVGEGLRVGRSMASVMVTRERLGSVGLCLKRDYDSSPE